MSFSRAFTLIELLIVVAIIAILAAIAVPNFLEAQTRAKVSRAKADMRSLAVGIETWNVDNNHYLYCNGNSSGLDQRNSQPNPRPNSRPTFERLTSPIAYLSSIFPDPFRGTKVWNDQWNTAGPIPARDMEVSRYYYYTARNNSPDANARWDEFEAGGEAKPEWYLLESSGPDLTRHNMQDALNLFPATDPRLPAAIYDPTNGTVSRGSIWRTGATSGRATDRKFQQLTDTAQK